jgi:CheY-like chemotaxis protein
MRKKVLIAEAADPVRTVAETVLRQHGYEVISVPDADRAAEVLQYSRPDLVIVSADLCTRDRHPLYEKIQNDPRSTTIPLLLFASETGLDVPFPQEVIIPRPFDPHELMQRVSAFAAANAPSTQRASANPLTGSSVDDEFLDEVLGLDRINITESEVLNKTSATSVSGGAAKSANKHDEMIHGPKETREMSDSSRVESVMIRDDRTDSTRETTAKKPAPAGTNKLEIMSDQYGLSDPNAFSGQHKDEAHDYDWFIKSMTEDALAPPTPHANTQPGDVKSAADGDELVFTDPASMAGPSTPITSVRPAMPSDTRELHGKSAGVEKFIDEFKKEIERLRSSEPEDLDMEERGASPGHAKRQMTWEEVVEKTSPEQVEIFTRQLASELAEKLAALIASKIDADKLLQLLKSELVARSSGEKHR